LFASCSTLLLPLDDLLVITREFINEKASRSGLARLLKRQGLNDLRALYPQIEGEKRPCKTFKDYEPGFVHIDVKYLPQMKDQSSRSYLFVAIDRASRWVYMEICKDKSARSAERFLKALIKAAPFVITKILTDNGKEFTDRFCATGERKPTGQHLFDKQCSTSGIEHRLIKPRTPQTNGMVERFNGRIAEVIRQTRFSSIDEMSGVLRRYEKLYNSQIPQRALGHIAPVDALKDWQKKRPKLFNKRIYKHTGPDKYIDEISQGNCQRIINNRVDRSPLSAKLH
jgi:transposase InsO family protein